MEIFEHGLDYDGDVLNGELVNTKKENNPFDRRYAKIWDAIIDEHASAGDIGFLKALTAVFVGKSEVLEDGNTTE